VATGFVEVQFLRLTDLDRRVDEAIVILGDVDAGHQLQGRCDVPIAGTWLKRIVKGVLRASTEYMRI